MKHSKKSHLNIKLIKSLAILFLFLSTTSFSQNYKVGARQGALGEAGVAIADVWALHYNQAALTFMETPAIGFFYENKYLTSVGFQSLGLVLPTEKGAWGFSFGFLGLQGYSEMKTALAYALKLSPAFSLGMQFDYLHTGYPSSYYYNGLNSLVAELSFFSKPAESLALGGHIFNPWTIMSNAEDKSLIETTMSMGVLFRLSDHLTTVVALEKDIRYSASIQFGIEYYYREKLYFRGGFSTNPNSFSVGIGYLFANFKTNIAFYTQPILGTTPQMDINYYFNKASVANAN